MALSAAALTGFLALHALPRAGALRSLFILLVLVGFAWSRRRQGGRLSVPAPGIEAALLAALTAWLFFQAAFLAPQPSAALAQLTREWGKLLALLALGIGLASICRMPRSPRCATLVVTGIFLGCFVHVPLTLGHHLWQWWQTGRLPLGESLLGNYGYISLPTNAALALLLADAASRLGLGKRLLPLSTLGVGLAIAATLLAHALLISKAGLIMTHVLGWTCLAALLRHGAPHRLPAVATVILALAAATLASVMVENRWLGATESIASGVATTEVPVAAAAAPPLPAPAAKDPSFYIRSFSAKLGLQGIVAHPLGLGYGADAFGRYVGQLQGVTGLISSENGWIDFALANGIPALLLLLALAAALCRHGWLAFRAGNPAGMALGLVTVNYIGRCAMDGFLTGSRLTAFALTAGILWALATMPAIDHATDPA
jgi:hypothetical protein